MHALLYRSRARPGLLAHDLNAIIASGEAKNPARDLTGLLLYAEMDAVPGAPGQFLQWIEGPKESVEDMYGTIESDERHTAVEVLGRGPTAELAGDAEALLDREGRVFPIWSLGMVRLSELPATLDGFLRFAGEWDGRALPRVS